MNQTMALIRVLLAGALLTATPAWATRIFTDDKTPHTRIGHWAEGTANAYVVILVKPKHCNERELLALGRWLRLTHRFEQKITVYIYNEEEAAKAHVAVLKNQNENDFKGPHVVGRYRRNKAENIHDLLLMPYGPEKEALEVIYHRKGLPANHSVERPAAR